MAVDAYIHHHLPGRLRLKVPTAKGEEQDLREISSAIARTPGITHVDYNPITGSILIQYSLEQYKNLRSLESSLNAWAPITVTTSDHSDRGHPSANHRRHPMRGRSSAARRVDSFFRQLDHEIRMATDNELDLKFILPFGVGALGLIAIRNSSTTPLWLTLLIFAFHAFLGLHAPMSEELTLAEGMSEVEA
jgi:hypothetical protein